SVDLPPLPSTHQSLRPFPTRRSSDQAPPQTIVTKLAQIFFPRFPGRRWILRILGAPKLKIEVTAFANFERVRNRFWKIAEQLPHLVCRLLLEKKKKKEKIATNILKTL